MNKYLKFEYWNECDLGNIYYQDGQHFIFYLDADVGEPLHEEVEEGQENGDGDFIPTYRRQIKRYRIRTGLIPDFLIDAMQRMKLHDNIELTFKTGEIEKIYNVDIEPEWQFEKYAWQGTVTMTFDMNESITVGACCENLVVEGEIILPTVTTGRQTYITETTATVYGEVTDDGGGTVTDRGICYNVSGIPTISDFTSSGGSGIGAFSCNLTGLTPDTPYYVRAYATNEAGTSYGSQQVFATEEEAVPSYFWVATDGDDTLGDGEFNNPWLTLDYAFTQVGPGETINMKAGTYNVSSQLVKPVGVSIKGQGDTTHIISTYVNASALQGAIQCASAAGVTTDDDSSISYIRLTGSNFTSQRAIYVGYRNKLEIHHCTIEDFNRSGIYIDASQTTYPTLYVTGIKIHDNTINDCSLREGAGGNYPGSLRLRGTDGCEVYNNTFDNTGRPNGQNGNTISPWRNKRLDFHDNVLYRNDHEIAADGSEEWNFFWEEWNYHGDSRVYRNTFYGLAQFSLGGLDNAVDEDCTFGYLVEENRFLNVANGNRTVNGDTRTIFGICVEGHNHKKVTISRNLLERFGFGIELSHPSANATYDRNWHWEDIIVAYNVLTECGYEDFAYGSAIWIIHEADPPEYTSTYSNIAFINNTITSKKGTYTGYCGFLFSMHGTITGLSVKNNIVDGFANDAVQINGTDGDTLTIIGLDVIHNNFYDNGTDAVDIESDPNVDVTNGDITTGNITTDPTFIGGSPYDYHLQAGSDCIDAGIDVGLTIDYDGVAVDDPPNIGAYE